DGSVKPEPEIDIEKQEPEQRPVLANARTALTQPEQHGLAFDTELQLAELMQWVGDDADSRTHAVLRHNWEQAPEAARVNVQASMRRAQPRHRAKWLVGAIKAETQRARNGTPAPHPSTPDTRPLWERKPAA